MLTLQICNDRTGTKESGNYDIVVRVNFKELARAKIHGYTREYGWLPLLRWAVNVLEESSKMEEKEFQHGQ